MGRKILRGTGAVLAMAVTAGLFAFVMWAVPQVDDLRTRVPQLDGQQKPSKMNEALNGAVGFAENQAQPPNSTGVGKGYVVSAPAPLASERGPGHWCGERVIGYRIDLTAGKYAGLNPVTERARWRDAFTRWSLASDGVYQFKYLGPAIFPTQDDASGYPIKADALVPGEIAITYAVPPARTAAKWQSYVHPEMTTALGLAGFANINWDEDLPNAGLITSAMVVLDAIDAAQDPHEVPTQYVHEVGHALGLGHVEDPGQIMFKQAVSNAVLNDGDRRGISKLAAAPCR